eukprot:gnl/Chilomastix_cuspidata/835.p1 GENE.gnl/Chilomastix_cuspidata/835~~gnl/Chilomastix_cuspidata/835.p1  ORF type:complete len:261 (-),score=120.09 gnl/Chilomastix_cuspidata/835:1032-1814(-)
MPQGDHIDLHRRRHGRRFDAEERERKRVAREHRVIAKKSRKLRGIKAKLHSDRRRREKIQMRKVIQQHEEKTTNRKAEKPTTSAPLPAYLLDRGEAVRSKVLAAAARQRTASRSTAHALPIPRVRPQSESEVLRVLRTGKRKRKQWKRLVARPVFVPLDFTRNPPKLERFVRPNALRYRDANVTHPELGVTVKLRIIGVKKNPSGQLLTSLGVLARGTVIEVNVAGLGLVTASGKVVWGKYAQITNNPERDGCVNAVLLA